VEGITDKFWNRRREVRCRFRDTAAVEQLWRLVEQQTAANVPTAPNSSTDAVPMSTPDAE
jgi:hypothetical protein